MYGNDKQNLGDSLELVIQDTGFMQKIHTNNATKTFGRKTPFFKRTRKEGINLTSIDPNCPDKN